MASVTGAGAGGARALQGAVFAAPVQSRQHLSAAAGMLAPAGGLTLPSLAGVQPVVQVNDDCPLVPQLAKALLRAGVADPTLWDGDVHRFIADTFNAWIDARGGHRIREVLYPVHALLCDGADRWGGYLEFEEGEARAELFIAIGADGDTVRSLVMQQTLDELERAHPRFPSTFYRWLLGVRSVIEIWDWHDAQEYEERMCEWSYGEFEESQGEAEPEPRDLVPAALKRPPLTERAAMEHMRHARGVAGDIMRAALELHRLSEKLVVNRADFGDGWEFRPLPALLLCMDAHDQIVGHFDAEMNDLFQQCEPFPPSLVFKLDAEKPAALRKTVANFHLACDVLNAAVTLIELMPGAIPPQPLAQVLAVEAEHVFITYDEDWE